jgi:DNA invertase Pin-like site-specific DNA recombinase
MLQQARKRVSRSASPSTRCAVYTRKSSEEGLEQDFNSLDAQREACEAFILSQKHEGWTVLPEMYDDGGISGATMERPSLKRLLSDIEAQRVDTVVVYKVDRLTRSLRDFAKIVDVFDRRGVSFVSVTQQFNTTTSMGRLTLNMLLSFAQFEREVTGERIRDKVAASKRKGMWMGGLPPLGYDIRDKKLVVNEAEAETVGTIYRLYTEFGSVRALKEALDSRGIVSKARIDKHGRRTGGKPLARGALYLMLQNRIYRGEIVHKDKSYPGRHEAIIDEALWNMVRETLLSNRVERLTGANASHPSLLAGLIYDHTGERMTPTHANKNGRRYRYYVSQSLIKPGRPKESDVGRRVPANDLERLVTDRVARVLKDELALFEATEPFVEDFGKRRLVVKQAMTLARRWPDLEPAEVQRIVQSLVCRMEVAAEEIKIWIGVGRLLTIVGSDGGSRHDDQATGREPTLELTVSAKLRRVGKETKFIIEGARERPPDRSMLRLLAQAHHYREIMLNSRDRSMTELAKEAGVGRSYFCRVIKLSFLAPEIVRAIISNRHPPELTAKKLSLGIKVPIAWDEQFPALGIAFDR